MKLRKLRQTHWNNTSDWISNKHCPMPMPKLSCRPALQFCIGWMTKIDAISELKKPANNTGSVIPSVKDRKMMTHNLQKDVYWENFDGRDMYLRSTNRCKQFGDRFELANGRCLNEFRYLCWVYAENETENATSFSAVNESDRNQHKLAFSAPKTKTKTKFGRTLFNV